MAEAASKRVAIGAETSALRRPARSLWRDALSQLTRNRAAIAGAVAFVLIVFVALTAPVIAPHDPIKLNPVDSLVPPSRQYPMGTDQFGRDILSRVIYGARTSVAMGFVAVAISVTAGSLL